MQADTSSGVKAWAKGGMATKLTAARIATAAGCATVICQATQPEVMLEVLGGAKKGTLFHAHPSANRCAVQARWRVHALDHDCWPGVRPACTGCRQRQQSL